MPDPWTFSEEGSPEVVADLLKLPRYLSKNYLDISVKEVFKLLPSFLRGLRVVPFQFDLFKELARTLVAAVRYRFAAFVFISFFDYLSTKAFIKLARKYKTEANIFFINSIAHAQHHYWHGETMVRLEYTYKYLDRIVGVLDEAGFFASPFVATNGLTQKNTNEEPAWILYRQNQPEKFFKSLNLGIVRSEQLMTHDSHLFFETEERCEKAFQILSSVQVKGQKLFFCEKDPSDRKKLFIRLDFYDDLETDLVISINQVQFNFFDEFTRVVRRTGKHIQRADVLSNSMKLEPEEMNYSIFHKTLALVK